MEIKGIMPALSTPLRADETVNTDTVRKLIEYFLEKGADGFYIAGATGEGLAIRPDERRILAETAVDTLKGRKPAIIQVASTDFSEAVALAKHAESIGADAISATPPLFFRYTEDDVYNYYKALANAVHIPVMMYNSPLAGFAITPAFAARVFEIDNVTSIKWTSSDYYGLMNLKHLTHGEMKIMNGPDEMLLMGLAAGADGGIGATYNVLFSLYRDIFDSFVGGDIKTAQRYQYKVTEFMNIWRTNGFVTISALKALLEESGFDMGDSTFPMKRYDAEQKKKIVSLMREAGWTDGHIEVQ